MNQSNSHIFNLENPGSVGHWEDLNILFLKSAYSAVVQGKLGCTRIFSGSDDSNYSWEEIIEESVYGSQALFP